MKTRVSAHMRGSKYGRTSPSTKCTLTLKKNPLVCQNPHSAKTFIYFLISPFSYFKSVTSHSKGMGKPKKEDFDKGMT